MVVAAEVSMFIEGSKSGVGFWYVCWGSPTQYNMTIYKTLNGLTKWSVGIGESVPIYRIGRIFFGVAGYSEKESWETKGAFIEGVRPLVPFSLPK